MEYMHQMNERLSAMPYLGEVEARNQFKPKVFSGHATNTKTHAA